MRGGGLDSDVLRSDAEDYRVLYATNGLSVFAARDVTVDELAQQPPLIRFRSDFDRRGRVRALIVDRSLQ